MSYTAAELQKELTDKMQKSDPNLIAYLKRPFAVIKFKKVYEQLCPKCRRDTINKPMRSFDTYCESCRKMIHRILG